MIQLPPGKQKPWLAILLSFLVVGGGQLYNRQFLKGLLLLVAFMGGWFCTFILAYGDSQAFAWWGFFFKAVPFWLAFDAYRIAARLREGEPVRTWQWF